MRGPQQAAPAAQRSGTSQVAERTTADKKGGHLARRKADGRFILRESAMCPDDDKAKFEDVHLHKFFNTNNLWVQLPKLQARPSTPTRSAPLQLAVRLRRRQSCAFATQAPRGLPV